MTVAEYKVRCLIFVSSTACFTSDKETLRRMVVGILSMLRVCAFEVQFIFHVAWSERCHLHIDTAGHLGI